MSATGALACLFECEPNTRFELNHLREEFGDEIDPLLRSGLIIEAPPALSVTCFDCEEAHQLSVECDEAGRLGRFCADGGGWDEVAPETLRRYAFDYSSLVNALAKALGAASPPPAAIVPGVCWRLGAASISGVEFLAILARELSDPVRLVEVGDELRRFRKWQGIVICGAHPPIHRGLLPRGLVTQTLDELVAVSAEGEAIVDPAALAEALGLKQRKRGEHGATSDHPALAPLIDKRRRTGACRPNASAEAHDLLADPIWARPTRKKPSARTLGKFIGRRWAKLT